MKKILIIEDTNALAENMADILINLEFDVMIVSNGEEAMDVICNFNPDLVITDVFMPVMDGLQFTESLRKTTKYSHVPVVMVSARATPDDVRTGLAAGANEYLKKPCNIEQLVEAITKLLH